MEESRFTPTKSGVGKRFFEEVRWDTSSFSHVKGAK